jgi:PAS domain-containing protein
MGFADLIAALLLPLPPWLGFWIFRRKGRIGLSYGYFLGGILTVLALPWAHLTALPIPASQLGGALFGFTLFLQAQREGVQGLRRLAVGVGGATGFLLLFLLRLHLPWQEVGHFWAAAILEALLWFLWSDLAYRWARGRQLEIRMPLVGAAALGTGALAQLLLPLTSPRLSWPAALLGGLLLGLVALQQLRWLRSQGAWVEGRAEGLRVALSLLDQTPAGAPSLSLGLEARQPIWLVDAQGQILDSNGPLSRLVGLPRHRLRGYGMDALFQGGDSAVWEGLRTQLLQYGCASLQATQVSEDGTFQQVGLEASTFDRGMALVWIADTMPGSLDLKGGSGAMAPGGEDETRRRTANALLALAAAVERLRSEAAGGSFQGIVDQIGAAAARLDPSSGRVVAAPSVDGAATLAALLPGLQALVPAGCILSLEAVAIPLALGAEPLRRIATHLVLHALEHATVGSLAVVLKRVDLGGRRFGLLYVQEAEGRKNKPKTLFGLGWLRQSVLEVGGLLELDQDPRGGLRPRIYLPTPTTEGTAPILPGSKLAGRLIWVVDRDPLVREGLMSLVQSAGGRAASFEDLSVLLRNSHGQPPPDVLVFERTARLERFQRAMRTFQKRPVPTLVLGMGQPLPLNPGTLGLQRLGFLEKPFRAEAFTESLLALLRQPDGPDPGLL